MKKFFTITIPLALAFFIALQFVSCEKYVLPEMYLSQDTLSFGPMEESQSITVYSNVIWSFKNDDSYFAWVEGSPDWGDADSVVVFKVKENTSPRSRSTTVNIKSETISRNLFIFQEGQPLDPSASEASSASPSHRLSSYTSPTVEE